MAYLQKSPIPVPQGGTGNITNTNHGILVGAGSSNLTNLSVGATGTVLIGTTSSDPSFSATPTVTSITISNSPSATTDGTNKAYVDAIAAGLEFKNACYVATTGSNLNATYVNGAAGIGATLTNAGSLAAFSLDGQSPALNSRILVKDQSTSYQNGIYTLTTVGSGAIAWILTRSTDYNQVAQIQAGDIVPIEYGTLNASTIWLQTATVATIGTDAITFALFSSSGQITITGDSGGGLTSRSFTFTGGTTGLTFAGAGSTETLGGTLVVSNGGTGAATLTGVLTGNGTSAVTANAVTQYGTVIAGASNAVSSVAPSATSGVPYISQGSSSNPAFGTAVVAGGGTGVATMTTAYAPVCAGTTATGALQVASTGLATSGYVLTSNGSSALPSFQAAAGGGSWVLIQTQTASSSASLDFTTGITSTYNNFVVVFSNIIPSTQNNILIRVSTDGGSTYATTGYVSSIAGMNVSSGGSYSALSGTNTDGFYLTGPGLGVAPGASGTVFLYGLTNGQEPAVAGNCTFWRAGNALWTAWVGGYSTSTTVNAIRIIGDAGTLTSGIVSLYGISK